MVYIYGLFNDLTNELVYVGKTRSPKDRLTQHRCSTAKKFKSHVRMEILQQGERLNCDDEYFWIEYMRFIGANLLNIRVRIADTPIFYHGRIDATWFHHCLSRYGNGTGISLEELSRLSRVSFQTVRRMARGLATSHRMKQKVATALKISFSTLVQKEATP